MQAELPVRSEKFRWRNGARATRFTYAPHEVAKSERVSFSKELRGIKQYDRDFVYISQRSNVVEDASEHRDLLLTGIQLVGLV